MGESRDIGRYITPELYHRFSRQVFEMSLAIQVYRGTTQIRESHSLTDAEIAERLGLSREEVAEIRSVAEIDLLPEDEWWRADTFKTRRARKVAREARESADDMVVGN